MIQVELKPLDKERLENVEYLVENNLPIEKQMLYEFMPDYFERDIEDLDLEDREEIRKNQMNMQIKENFGYKIVRRKGGYKGNDIVENFHEEYRIKEKKLFWIQKQKEDSFNEHIEFKKKYLMHENKRNNFFYFLGIVDEKNLLDEEIEIKKKTIDLNKFFDDKEKFFEVKDKELGKLMMENIIMYPFVERHPVLKAAWIKNFKEVARYDIDYNDLMMHKGLKNKVVDRFEEKMKAPYIRKKVKEYNTITFTKKGLVHHLQDFDVHSKNDMAVKKTKLFGEILNEISDENDRNENPNQLDPDNMSDDLLYEDEEENKETEKISNYPKKSDFEIPNVFKKKKHSTHIPGKMYYEELSRMYYLNNTDPMAYNIAFFSEYFNIEPKMLRKVVKFVSVPFEDKRTGRIVKILRFIDL